MRQLQRHQLLLLHFAKWVFDKQSAAHHSKFACGPESHSQMEKQKCEKEAEAAENCVCHSCGSWHLNAAAAATTTGRTWIVHCTNTFTYDASNLVNVSQSKMQWQKSSTCLRFQFQFRFRFRCCFRFRYRLSCSCSCSCSYSCCCSPGSIIICSWRCCSEHLRISIQC